MGSAGRIEGYTKGRGETGLSAARLKNGKRYEANTPP